MSERAEVHRSRDSSLSESLSDVEPSFEFRARPVPKAVREPRRPAPALYHKELTTPVRPSYARPHAHPTAWARRGA